MQNEIGQCWQNGGASLIIRKQRDIDRLKNSSYEVKQKPDSPNLLGVIFKGPEDSIYKDGTWLIQVFVPDRYPIKPPSIAFINKIIHPNIDMNSGVVCMDLINQAWNPQCDLLMVFDLFLPQLLLQPNTADPLNEDAASLLANDPVKFKETVVLTIKKYAIDPDRESDTEGETEEENKSLGGSLELQLPLKPGLFEGLMEEDCNQVPESPELPHIPSRTKSAKSGDLILRIQAQY